MKTLVTFFTFWVFTFTYSQGWIHYTSDDGLIEGIVSSLIHDNSGKIWFSDWTNNNSQGIGNFDGVTWNLIGIPEGAPSNAITSTFQDSVGNFWFSSFYDEGIAKYDGVDWTYYTIDDGLISNFVWSFFQDSSENIWMLGYGISVFDGSNWINYDTINGQEFVASSMIEDNDGFFWITSDIGLLKYNGTVWEVLGVADGYSTDSPDAIFLDSNNNIWTASFTTGTGIDKYDGTTITTYSYSDGIPNIDVRYSGCFAEDLEGNIFIGTNSGIAVFDGINWTNIGVTEGLPNPSIRAVLMNDDGSYWVSTFNGLSFFDPTLGIVENKKNDLEIFPIPVTEKLYLSKNDNIIRIEMYDSSGRRVYQLKKDNILYADVSSLESGVYIIEITDINNTKTTKRIVKR